MIRRLVKLFERSYRIGAGSSSSAPTTESVHGFPVPVAEGKWRRSVALYYYTAAPTKNFSGDEMSYWREHGEQAGIVRKARFLVWQRPAQPQRSSSASWPIS